MSPPFGVATVDLTSGEVSWLNLFNPYITSDHYFGQYAEVKNGRWAHVKGPLPALEPIKVLFGSEQNPVLAAQVTRDRMSFVFIQYGGGWFWKTSLMRYDVPEAMLRSLRTLERGLYSE
jgi:hypothetical protein